MKKHNKTVTSLKFGISACIFGIVMPLQANTFSDKVNTLMKEHNLIKMVDADVAVSKAKINVEKSPFIIKLVIAHI